MSRTTIDIDPSVLAALRARGRRERKTLGRLVSELLTVALDRDDGAPIERPFNWITRPMRARIDLEDKDAVRRATEGS